MVYEILLTGKHNAQTSKEICKLLNITTRELTSLIERERRAGKPICASTGARSGYYIAASRDEMERYCRSLYHRAGEIFKTRRACMATIDQLPEVI